MRNDVINELAAIADRYKEHGVTLPMLIDLAEKAPPELPELAIIAGVKLALANEHGTSETFTIEEVAAITGETPAEVRERIRAEGIQVIHQTAPGKHKPS